MSQQIPPMTLKGLHRQNHILLRQAERFHRKKDPHQGFDNFDSYLQQGIKLVADKNDWLMKPVNVQAGKFYLTIPLATFRRVVEEIVVLNLGQEDVRMRYLACLLLQSACEDYLVDTFRLAGLCMAHRRKKTIKIEDFRLVRAIRGEFERSNIARTIQAQMLSKLKLKTFTRRSGDGLLRRGRPPRNPKYLPPALRPRRTQGQ